MTDDFGDKLAYATGSALAAANMVRALMQIMIQEGVIPKPLLVESLEMNVVILEEMLGRVDDGPAKDAIGFQIGELQSALEELRNLPPAGTRRPGA